MTKAAGRPKNGTGRRTRDGERATRETVDRASSEPIPGRGNGHDQAVRKDQRGQEQPADKKRAEKNK